MKNEHVAPQQNPRIGVLLCRCGGEISEPVDLEALKDDLASSPGIPQVEILPYSCSKKGIEAAREIIQKENLEGLVVAGCSPRTHRGCFEELLRDVGVDSSRFEMANLREHCAHVHPGAKRRATKKAADLVRMAAAKVAKASPRSPVGIPVEKRVLVMGAGVTGLTAALSLSGREIPVLLVEKEVEAGGIIRGVGSIFPSYQTAEEVTQELVKKVEGDPLITLCLESSVETVQGHVGQFKVLIKTPEGSREEVVGAVIVATGSEMLEPVGLFEYGENPRVVTQMELENLLLQDKAAGDNVVMIQCVGSRNEERPYCSRICCVETVKNTIVLKERNPPCKVTVLSRGFAQYVPDLDRARSMGVEFIRYDPERPPTVGEETVSVWDAIKETETQIPYDRVVLATPMIPRDEDQNLTAMLRLERDEYGFLLEPEINLRPGQYLPRGVFVAGSTHFPATINECIAQAHSASARASSVIEASILKKDPSVAEINQFLCRACGRCEEVCKHGAAELRKTEEGRLAAFVDEVPCVGCGSCVSLCPSGAIRLAHLPPGSMETMLEAAFGT